MKKLLLSLVMAFAVISIPVLQTGCANQPSTRTAEVTTLKVVGTSAKATLDASAQLLRKGQITVAQWTQIATFYDTKFQPAYNLAVAAVQSDLSSVASPDLIALAAQFAAFVAQVTAPPTSNPH